MTDSVYIDRLEAQLARSRPGKKAQRVMSPISGEVDRYYQAPEHANRACVLLILYPKNDNWHTAFMKRSTNIHDKHSGQISFPGGRYEKSDLNFVNCALRETEEELGILRNDIQIIGQLSDLYVFASNHLVYPFVGVMNKTPTFTLDKEEVDSVIEVPIQYFMKKEIAKMTDLQVGDYFLKNVPYYDLYGEVLWGATAMMMSEFINIWSEANE